MLCYVMLWYAGQIVVQDMKMRITNIVTTIITMIDVTHQNNNKCKIRNKMTQTTVHIHTHKHIHKLTHKNHRTHIHTRTHTQLHVNTHTNILFLSNLLTVWKNHGVKWSNEVRNFEQFDSFASRNLWARP